MKFARTKLVGVYFRTWAQTSVAGPDSQRGGWHRASGSLPPLEADHGALARPQPLLPGRAHSGVSHCPGPEVVPPSEEQVSASTPQQRREAQAFPAGFWGANPHL